MALEGIEANQRFENKAVMLEGESYVFDLTTLGDSIDPGRVRILTQNESYDPASGVVSFSECVYYFTYLYDTRRGEMEVVVSSSLPYLEINEDSFPDEGFRSWLIEQMDPVYNFDTGSYSLTKDQVDHVTMIYCPDRPAIHSLKGIEFFPGLEELWCMACGLTELDVSHLLLGIARE